MSKGPIFDGLRLIHPTADGAQSVYACWGVNPDEVGSQTGVIKRVLNNRDNEIKYTTVANLTNANVLAGVYLSSNDKTEFSYTPLVLQLSGGYTIPLDIRFYQLSTT